MNDSKPLMDLETIIAYRARHDDAQHLFTPKEHNGKAREAAENFLRNAYNNNHDKVKIVQQCVHGDGGRNWNILFTEDYSLQFKDPLLIEDVIEHLNGRDQIDKNRAELGITDEE